MTEPKETTLVARVRALVGYDDTYARAILDVCDELEAL